MLTRRDVFVGAGAAGIAAAGLPGPSAAAVTKPSFVLPRGACDCHVHVVGDAGRFPMAPNRVYTPPPASVRTLLDLQNTLGFDRVVLVQPSFYGVDNAAMLDGLRQLGLARARGVAVVGETATDADLDTLRSAGVSGLRLNLETGGAVDAAAARGRLRAAAARCHPRNWHIQLYSQPSVIAALAGDLTAFSVPVVLDHFAGAQAASGLGQLGFDAVLALVHAGKAYVKLSAPYRESTEGPLYDDIRPLAQALVAANPERVLWGSDWPHTDATRSPGRSPMDITPNLPVDDGLVLDLLPRWVPDSAARRLILTENPARLYEF